MDPMRSKMSTVVGVFSAQMLLQPLNDELKINFSSKCSIFYELYIFCNFLPSEKNHFSFRESMEYFVTKWHIRVLLKILTHLLAHFCMYNGRKEIESSQIVLVSVLNTE